MRVLLTTLVITLATWVALPGGTTHAANRPNIIFVMADDLGYGDLGCYGQTTLATPHIDALARDGLRFTDFYAGCTVCRPSRLVLWTGQHTGHTAISSNASYVFKPQDVTIAELLKQAGYATGGVGKWAMGNPGNSGHPNDNGFDLWMGYLDQCEAHKYYPTHLWRNREKFPLPGNVLSTDPAARGRVAIERVTYSHDVMTEQAFDFIRQHAGRTPFLMHMHWTVPHVNNEGARITGNGLEVPDVGPYGDRDWPDNEKGFAGMIHRLDHDMGRLIDLLRELKIDNNTLVFFTSDNGAHHEGHDHEFFNSNGELRGYKRDLYEGGIRVPMIAWWPGHVAPNTTCNTPLAFWDVMPTFCELAGTEPAANTDGISFVAALNGQPQPDHEYLFWKFQQKTAVRMGKWKGVRLGNDRPWELYDLENDVSESTSIARQHSDVVEKIDRAVLIANKTTSATE
ncbi:MAG: arylsulfatase [Planctomycetales bacterium]|nr:arylsulfatase [Planctomycetales bacterium]